MSLTSSVNEDTWFWISRWLQQSLCSSMERKALPAHHCYLCHAFFCLLQRTPSRNFPNFPKSPGSKNHLIKQLTELPPYWFQLINACLGWVLIQGLLPEQALWSRPSQRAVPWAHCIPFHSIEYHHGPGMAGCPFHMHPFHSSLKG